MLVKQAAKRAVKMYCQSCREEKVHDEHEDDAGNTHAFCRSCKKDN
ncbi:MAG: hypothetical protein K2V38_25730 [Gemmataceae bacterium]|nr:hypothetical protein [Gemmataceae bacterium]